jgi:hypothetical protein
VTELPETKPVIYLARGEVVSILSFVVQFPNHGEGDGWNRVMEERMEELSVYSFVCRDLSHHLECNTSAQLLMLVSLKSGTKVGDSRHNNNPSVSLEARRRLLQPWQKERGRK